MQAIDDYIEHVRFLPPAPQIVPQLLKLLKQPDVESSQIVRLISLDPSLTANVLRICNSAYFAAANPTYDLTEAVTRLGFQQVFQLVTLACGAKLLGGAHKGYGLDAGELWKHSVSTAIAAKSVAANLDVNPDTAFTAALLHDLGKIILAQSLENAYFKLIHETEINQQSLIEAEKKILGVNHAEVGGQLLTRWKFSPAIVAAVWHHHTPQAAETPHQRLAACVYIGNMIAHFMGHGYGHQAFALRGRAAALDILGMSADTLPQMMIETSENLHQVDSLFSLAA